MASDEEEELDVLRSAVLASMKAKLRQKEKAVKTGSPAPQDDLEDDPELAALRTVALLSKNAEKEQKKKEAQLARQQQQKHYNHPANVYGPNYNCNFPPHQYASPSHPPFPPPGQPPFAPAGQPLNYGSNGQMYPPAPPAAPAQPMGFTKGNLFVIQPVELPKAQPNTTPKTTVSAETKPKELGRFSRFEGSESEDEEEEESFQEPAKSESEASASSSSDQSDIEESTADDKGTQSDDSQHDQSDLNKENQSGSDKENQSESSSSSDSSDSDSDSGSSSKSNSRSSSTARSRSRSVSPRHKRTKKQTSKSPVTIKSTKALCDKTDDLKHKSKQYSRTDSKEMKLSKTVRSRSPSPVLKSSKANRTKDKDENIQTGDISRRDGKSTAKLDKSRSEASRDKSRSNESRDRTRSEGAWESNDSRDVRSISSPRTKKSHDTRDNPIKEKSADKNRSLPIKERLGNKSEKSQRDVDSERRSKRDEQVRKRDEDMRKRDEDVRNRDVDVRKREKDLRKRDDRDKNRSSISSRLTDGQRKSSRSRSRERHASAERASASKSRDSKTLPRGYKEERLRNQNTRDRDRLKGENTSNSHSHSRRNDRELDTRNRRNKLAKSPSKTDLKKSTKRKPSLSKTTRKSDLVHSSDSSFSDSSSSSSGSSGSDSDSDSDSGRDRKKSERRRDDIERDRRQRELTEREDKRKRDRRERRRESPVSAKSRDRKFERKSSPQTRVSPKHTRNETWRENVRQRSNRDEAKSRHRSRDNDADFKRDQFNYTEKTRDRISSGNRDKSYIKESSNRTSSEKTVKRDRQEILRELEKIDSKLKGRKRLNSKDHEPTEAEVKSTENANTETKRMDRSVESQNITSEKDESMSKNDFKDEKKPEVDDSLDSLSDPEEEVTEPTRGPKRKRSENQSEADDVTASGESRRQSNDRADVASKKVKAGDIERTEPVISVTFNESEKEISSRPSVHNRLGIPVQSKDSDKRTKHSHKRTNSGRRIIQVEDDSANSGDLRNILSRKKISIDNDSGDLDPERPKLSVRDRLTLNSKSHISHRRDGQLGIKRRVHIERSADGIDLDSLERPAIKSRLDVDYSRPAAKSRRVIRVDQQGEEESRDTRDRENTVTKAKTSSSKPLDSQDSQESRTSAPKKVKLKRARLEKPAELKPEEKEKEMELDERIKKIKERNLAIERRQKEIEAERKRFA